MAQLKATIQSAHALLQAGLVEKATARVVLIILSHSGKLLCSISFETLSGFRLHEHLPASLLQYVGVTILQYPYGWFLARSQILNLWGIFDQFAQELPLTLGFLLRVELSQWLISVS